ncbi:hypothetical protein GCM10023238_04980 [Streptomyces heliomycini]
MGGGNGRMSRFLQTLMIARQGEWPPSSLDRGLAGAPRNTWEYYRELQRRGATYRPTRTSPIVRFNLTAYHSRHRPYAIA